VPKDGNGDSRPRRALRGETAAKLLALAAQEFRENGFHATTTRQLSAALGIEKASLYYHVDSKYDLLDQICRRSLDEIFAAVSDAVKDETDPRLRITKLVHAHVDTMLRDQDMHATMLVELRALKEPQRAEVVSLRARYEDFVRAELFEAQRAGALDSTYTSHDVCLALLNLLNWTIFWYHADGPRTSEQIAEFLTSVFLDGVALSP
jgi:AcrR family transcriptional regulator